MVQKGGSSDPYDPPLDPPLVLLPLLAKYIPQLLACHDYKVCPKQLEYSGEICDQTGCRLKTKSTGVESCMAQVCWNVANSCLNKLAL